MGNLRDKAFYSQQMGDQAYQEPKLVVELKDAEAAVEAALTPSPNEASATAVISRSQMYDYLSAMINDRDQQIEAARLCLSCRNRLSPFCPDCQPHPAPSPAPLGDNAALIAETRHLARCIRESEAKGDATIADPDQLDELADALEASERENAALTEMIDDRRSSR